MVTLGLLNACSFAEQVRRIDVELRSRFPHLQTSIYEVSELDYVIVFDLAVQDAGRIASEFNSDIRFATVPVRLANQAPPIYNRELRPILDHELSKGFAGLSLTTFELENLLRARFENFPLIGSRLIGGHWPTLELIVASEVSTTLEADVLRFCKELGTPSHFLIVLGDLAANPEHLPIRDPLKVVATRSRPSAPEYAKADEKFWFDNVDKIYSGLLSPEEIIGTKSGSKCFLDCQIGQQINLRQTLLMYDEVFCALPLEEYHEKFLAEQGVTDDDLVTMAAHQRLRVVTLQPEERTNLSVLQRIAEASPSAMLGRRQTASILLADLVRTASEYRLGASELSSPMRNFCKEVTGSPEEARTLLNVLQWPIVARRRSFQALHERASKGFPAIGVATLLPDAEGEVDQIFKTVSLILNERVQVGHALNATVLPGRDENEAHLGIMNIQGDLLNFYRSFNTRLAAGWLGDQERRSDFSAAVPLIPVFEFQADVPVSEFLDATSLRSTREKGRTLMDRLASISPEQRWDEVARLDRELRTMQAVDTGRLLSVESLDQIWSVLAAIAGWFAPPLLAALGIGRKIVERNRRSEFVDLAVQSFEADLASMRGKTQDLDFLSRVDRVARLRRPTLK